MVGARSDELGSHALCKIYQHPVAEASGLIGVCVPFKTLGEPDRADKRSAAFAFVLELRWPRVHIKRCSSKAQECLHVCICRSDCRAAWGIGVEMVR